MNIAGWKRTWSLNIMDLSKYLYWLISEMFTHCTLNKQMSFNCTLYGVEWMNECIHTSYPYKLLCACMYVICMYNLTLFFYFFVCVYYMQNFLPALHYNSYINCINELHAKYQMYNSYVAHHLIGREYTGTSQKIWISWKGSIFFVTHFRTWNPYII